MERRELQENIKVGVNRMSFGDGRRIKPAQNLVQL